MVTDVFQQFVVMVTQHGLDLVQRRLVGLPGGGVGQFADQFFGCDKRHGLFAAKLNGRKPVARHEVVAYARFPEDSDTSQF